MSSAGSEHPESQQDTPNAVREKFFSSRTNFFRAIFFRSV